MALGSVVALGVAVGLGLGNVIPLVDAGDDAAGLGAGRFGDTGDSITADELAARAKSFLGIDRLRIVGDPARSVSQVAVACGSAGQFLADAREAGCDLLVTGETNFHTCLEAEANDVALLLPGHYASERFAVEYLANELAEEFDLMAVWASRQESDPLRWRS